MTFLEAVNRVLRMEGIILGDDDDLTSFSDTQHAATQSMARIAIQSQLADLVSDGYIPYENSTGTFTTVSGTRTYALAADFQRFQENFIDKLDSSNTPELRVIAYPGGESQLRKDFDEYQENPGQPVWFYALPGTTKQIGLYPIPDDASVGTYRYYYEADVSVESEADVLPFVTRTEAETFCRMAARHFKYMKSSPEVREGLFPQGIESDPVITASRATLVGLLNPMPEKRSYGKRYG
jgi:hypothetical protein